MKTYSTKKVIRILKNNNWKLDRIRGDHYIYKKEGIANIISLPTSYKDVKVGILKDIERKSGIRF